jgi:hypothetical protein
VTVSIETCSVEYAGNGVTTVFPITFPFQDDSHIVATSIDEDEVETLLVINTDYTLTGEGEDDGALTMLEPLDTGLTIRIERTVPLTQTTTFRRNGSFSPAAHEAAFDKLTMEAQQQERDHAGLEDRVDDAEDDIDDLTTGLSTETSNRVAGDAAILASLATELEDVRTELDSSPGSTVDTRTVVSSGSTTARSLATRFNEVLNVLDFGAVGDGVADDTAAIVAALAAAPARVYGWSTTTNRPQNAIGIYFPTRRGAAPASYRVTARIDIPATKNVRLFSDAHHSARITMDNALENYIFRVIAGDGQRPVSFENLILHKGGIEYESGARRQHAIRSCVFENAPEWGVHTLGISVIDVRIEDCHFTEGVGGINIANEQCDTWVIRQCEFVRNSGVDLKIQTSGVHVEHCDFEVKQTNPGNPFVQIASDGSGVRPGNDIVFFACRFGNEANPPRSCIVIGPLGGISTASTGAIWFISCLWRGANAQTPTADQGKNCFELNQSAKFLHIINPTFFTYTNFVEENASAGSTPASSTAGPNFYHGIITNSFQSKMFTQGGVGWEVNGAFGEDQPDRGMYLRAKNSPYRGGYNLLPRTGVAMANGNWIATNTTVTKDVTGPDGVASSAHKLIRTAGGASANVRCQTSSTDPVTGAMTFAVWLKQGSGSFARARIGIIDGGNLWRSKLMDVALGTDWQRYEVTAYGLSAQQVTCEVLIGDQADTTINDEIYLAEPAAWKGVGSLPHVPNDQDSSTNIHAPLQWQALVIGRRIVGYGSAAPSSGVYAAGDIYLNTGATAATNPFWYCTVSGTSGGTWVAFGAMGLKAALTATAALNFPNIVTLTSQELTITVTGAAVGDSVVLGPPAAIEANLTWAGYVSAADTVTIRVSNPTAGDINPASATWRATVLKH